MTPGVIISTSLFCCPMLCLLIDFSPVVSFCLPSRLPSSLSECQGPCSKSGKPFRSYSFLWLGTTSCRPPDAIGAIFLVDSESGVRHDQLQADGAIRPSLAWCFSVVEVSVFGSLGSQALVGSESDVRHDQLQAADAIHRSLLFQCGGGVPFWKPGTSFWS